MMAGPDAPNRLLHRRWLTTIFKKRNKKATTR
jgi:hypothetical protein